MLPVLQVNTLLLDGVAELRNITERHAARALPVLTKRITAHASPATLCKQMPRSCKVLKTANITAGGACGSSITNTTGRSGVPPRCQPKKWAPPPPPPPPPTCELGRADARVGFGSRNAWGAKLLPEQDGVGSCTVLTCFHEKAAPCFPFAADLVRPPHSSMAPNPPLAGSVAVTCEAGRVVGAFTAAPGYTLSNACVHAECGDRPDFCPAALAQAATALRGSESNSTAVTAGAAPARIEAGGFKNCLCPSGCAPFVWVEVDVKGPC